MGSSPTDGNLLHQLAIHRVLQRPDFEARAIFCTAQARTLRAFGGRAVAVVAQVGDGRTQTVEDLRAVHDPVRAVDLKIWLHAGACWGLLAAFSPRGQEMIGGIFEVRRHHRGITVDPHKIIAVQ